MIGPPKTHTKAEFLFTSAFGSKLSPTGETSSFLVMSMHQK